MEIGNRLKRMGNIIEVVGIIFSFIYAFYVYAVRIYVLDFVARLLDMSVSQPKRMELFLAFVIMLSIGVLVSIAVGHLFYGFGQLICDTNSNVELAYQITEILRQQPQRNLPHMSSSGNATPESKAETETVSPPFQSS